MSQWFSFCRPPDKGGASNASGGFCFSQNPNPPFAHLPNEGSRPPYQGVGK